jgi:hypothetical protein
MIGIFRTAAQKHLGTIFDLDWNSGAQRQPCCGFSSAGRYTLSEQENVAVTGG